VTGALQVAVSSSHASVRVGELIELLIPAFARRVWDPEFCLYKARVIRMLAECFLDYLALVLCSRWTLSRSVVCSLLGLSCCVIFWRILMCFIVAAVLLPNRCRVVSNQ